MSLAVSVVIPCSGTLVTNGAYSGPAASTFGGAATVNLNTLVKNYNFAVSGNLCMAADLEGYRTTATGAISLCQAKATDGATWRMPNLAEVLANKDRWGAGDGSHWSSTHDGEGYYWFMDDNGLGKNEKGTARIMQVRCVRSL
jgi:hypothetical protein